MVLCFLVIAKNFASFCPHIKINKRPNHNVFTHTRGINALQCSLSLHACSDIINIKNK